jgi:hypothetical protein
MRLFTTKGGNEKAQDKTKEEEIKAQTEESK